MIVAATVMYEGVIPHFKKEYQKKANQDVNVLLN
jgi:hypothetical protein